jgi:hypothetical protein
MPHTENRSSGRFFADKGIKICLYRKKVVPLHAFLRVAHICVRRREVKGTGLDEEMDSHISSMYAVYGGTRAESGYH